MPALLVHFSVTVDSTYGCDTSILEKILIESRDPANVRWNQAIASLTCWRWHQKERRVETTVSCRNVRREPDEHAGLSCNVTRKRRRVRSIDFAN